jgi:hypothetical protein
MLLLDKIYLYIYWVVNKRLNPQKTTIWALNYLLFPVLCGFLVFAFSIALWLITFKLSLKIVIFICLVISFFLSEKLIEMYYTDENQKKIIENNKKPGIYRYLIVFIIMLLSIFSMILFSLFAGIILHKPTIW